MGNDNSKLKGLEIDKNAVEANDFFILYNAESPTTSNADGRQLLSIFQGEPVVNGQLWVSQGPMERAIKNLRIYRHPYILKYVATWDESSHKYLATERVRPLNDLLATQTDIQVCLGLRTILCSLIFLIEKAMARHLNICCKSIYITDNNSWRLAGFEFVWKAKDVNKQLLNLARSFRYQAAMDTAETLNSNNDQYDSIEQFAFATLCEEVLEKLAARKCETSITPHIQDFRAYCATHLKHKNPQLRPKLSAVLLHPYFNHEFILIHSFLFELPLKSVQEKQQFFTSLIDRLRYFNELVVAAQLATDLLSRMVLLDPTAQLCVTPYVLRSKTEHSAALFSQQVYKDHLLPKILKMFRLRDAQIRLILLEYFMDYVRLLNDAELQDYILPHLLVGMNDTNDVLVAKTLRCLADLVPILGATTVIGGQRVRLFSDGRPQAAVSDSTTHWVEPRSITPVMGSQAEDFMVSSSPLPSEHAAGDLSGSFNSLSQAVETEHLESRDLPLRLSPDGGEDDKSAIIVDGHNVVIEPNNVDDEELILQEANNEQILSVVEDETWSDWETTTTDDVQRFSDNHTNGMSNSLATDQQLALPNIELLQINNRESGSSNMDSISSSSFNTLATQNSSTQSDSYRTALSFNGSASTSSTKTTAVGAAVPARIIDDLNALDIQVQVSATPRHESTEIDFFKDMEPVIETKNNIPQTMTQTSKSFHADEEIQIDVSRFAATNSLNEHENDGWGMDDDDDEDATVVWANTS